MSEDSYQNWSGGVRCKARRVSVRDEAELPALIASASNSAADRSGAVRVRGTGHSFVPFWQEGDTVLDLDALAGLIDIDTSRAEAEFWAGTKLHDTGAPLWAAGFALANMGDIDTQALAGAISTATHGTGAKLGNIASKVVALQWIDGAGNVQRVSDHATLDGVTVACGLLGVVTRVRLAVLPRYGLLERQWQEAPEVTLTKLAEHIAGHRHFEFFYVPRAERCYCKSLDVIEPPASDIAVAELPFGNEGERHGASYRILPSVREMRFNEMEYSVPAEQGPACFVALRELLQRDFPRLTWPLEYRSVAADTRWLSPHVGRASVTISVHEAAAKDYRPLFDAAEPILRAHGGRPHWGKLHRQTAASLAADYPRWQDFAALRDRYDPQRRFTNAYARQVFGD